MVVEGEPGIFPAPIARLLRRLTGRRRRTDGPAWVLDADPDVVPQAWAVAVEAVRPLARPSRPGDVVVWRPDGRVLLVLHEGVAGGYGDDAAVLVSAALAASGLSAAWRRAAPPPG